jgi:hypothetical protein
LLSLRERRVAKPLVQLLGVGWPGQNWCSLRDLRLARIAVVQYQERRLLRIIVEVRLARIAFATPM